MTLQAALVAYRTCARAEDKSPKTVAWVVSSMGYFTELLGPNQQGSSTTRRGGSLTGRSQRNKVSIIRLCLNY